MKYTNPISKSEEGMNTEEEIRSKLLQILNSPGKNYDAILSLSNELAKFDYENVRFSVDAGIIDRLGSELVARQETAVSELVKNAYDADAVEVKLEFFNSSEVGGSLVIWDNGTGMTREQLVNGFMRISSTEKISNPFSELYHRKRAGQKGIGRFAVQRLGDKLTIITQSKSSHESYKLTIEWDKYSGDNDLYAITNSIEVLPELNKPGTTLRIEGLRDRWTEAAIKRIYRYVSDIIQPFPLSEIEQQTIEDNRDPGFKAEFYLNISGDSKKIGDERIMIYDHAVATIDGEIDGNGKGNFEIDSPKLGLHFEDGMGMEPEKKDSPFTQVKNLKFRAYYYIYDSGLISPMHATAIKKMAAVSGGIRLYRNGFRVLPYGEPGDDWLSLDLSTRKRTILPVHANSNFFGFVEVNDSSGNFEETSSREGLMNNESFIQLQNFVYRTIVTAVLKIAEIRNVKITSGQKKENGIWEKMDVKIKNIAYTLDELDKALESGENNIVARKKRKKRFSKLKKELKEIQKMQKEERAKVFNERSMLRVLSSVGLTVGQFVHEIKYYLDNIQEDIATLLQDLKGQVDALARLSILDENFATFQTYLSYFDGVISQNVIRELRPLELRTVVRPFIVSLKSDAEKSGITFLEPVYRHYGMYTRPMHPSEWSSILFNFYTNSRKAIKRTSNMGKILIECGEEQNMVYLEFSDNGDGIPKENEEHIFEEFFTTTSQDSLEYMDSNKEILGTGLGLKIVKDIVSSYKGNVRVVSPKGDFSTCIRVEIPKANDKELEKYGV